MNSFMGQVVALGEMADDFECVVRLQYDPFREPARVLGNLLFRETPCHVVLGGKGRSSAFGITSSPSLPSRT